MRISTVCLLAFLTLLAQLEVVVVTDHAVTFFTMGEMNGWNMFSTPLAGASNTNA